MLQTGIVKKLNNNTADVEITRSSACGDNCASCGLCPGRTATVTAVNEPNAKVGDTVIIDMSDKKVLGAAALVYIAPLAALIAGYLLCRAVTQHEGISILTGFLFLAAAFFVISRADRRLHKKYTPRITHIEEHSHDGE